MQYNDSFSENVHSYVNNINTIEGGTHLTGFRRALTRTLKKYAEDSGMLAKLKVRYQRRRLPRGSDGRSFGQGRRTAVRRADQDQTGQRRGVGSGRSGDVDGLESLPGGESARRQSHRTESHPGCNGPARGAPCPRNGAAQDRAFGCGPSGQVGGLFEPRPFDRRNLLRRGRLGRRYGQAGSRPELPGDHAAAR